MQISWGEQKCGWYNKADQSFRRNEHCTYTYTGVNMTRQKTRRNFEIYKIARTFLYIDKCIFKYVIQFFDFFHSFQHQGWHA